MFEWFEQTVYGTITWFNLLTALLILLGALLVSKLVSVQLRRSLKDKLSKENLEMLIKVLSYSIIIIAAFWIMPTIGLEPSGLMVAGGIVALAIGFASQSIIGNLISGLFLMGERPVKIGDLVEISGHLGTVEDIQIISTSIRTLDGLYIRIPNETVFTSSITNFSTNPVRRFEFAIGISYADDAEKAITIIKDTAAAHPLILINPPPQVFVDGLGDSSVDIISRFWAPTSDWYSAKMELLWKIKAAIEDAGIEIPFPQQVLWFGAGQNSEQLNNNA
jgi:small-conductance mechanosensitive channel